MADHFGSDLDQLLTQCSEQPLPDRLWQSQSPQKITKVVSQSKELKSGLIIHKIGEDVSGHEGGREGPGDMRGT